MAEDVQDIGDLGHVRHGCAEFLDSVVVQLGIKDLGDLSNPVLNKLKKANLVEMLHNSINLLEELTACTSDFRNTSSSMKTQLIESQRSIINLQSELLMCKNEKLESLDKAVKSSIKDTIGAEMETYCSIVQKNQSTGNSVISAEDVKTAVQSAVQAEDRSKNLMIFGLHEQLNENINDMVGEVFHVLDEKPRIEACRFGPRKTDESARPIKVTASCAAVVNQILSKVRKLKQTEKYKAVYVCPDRSPEERVRQRELVKTLKKLFVEQPDKKHFIKNGEIISIEKKT